MTQEIVVNKPLSPQNWGFTRFQGKKTGSLYYWQTNSYLRLPALPTPACKSYEVLHGAPAPTGQVYVVPQVSLPGSLNWRGRGPNRWCVCIRNNWLCNVKNLYAGASAPTSLEWVSGIWNCSNSGHGHCKMLRETWLGRGSGLEPKLWCVKT